MIETIEEQIKYEMKENKIYVPKYDENFKYILNNGEITIITNENCRTQNTQRYCNCYRYNIENNIVTNAYECNATTQQNYVIDKQYITNDPNYNIRITNEYFKDKILGMTILIIAIIFTILMFKERRTI